MKNRIAIDDILALFEDNVDGADIISAKCMSELSSSIARKRLGLGLTQKQFAEHIQVSQTMVSKWEGGDYNFSIKSLAELADKLDMDLHVSLKEYREVVEVNYIDSNAYTTFPKKQYVVSGSGMISFAERKGEIYRRKQKEERLEM